MVTQLTCAWPARWEKCSTKLSKEVATCGASTEVGKVVMEYRLFTEEMKKSLPHVVIWALAPDDFKKLIKLQLNIYSDTHASICSRSSQSSFGLSSL